MRINAKREEFNKREMLNEKTQDANWGCYFFQERSLFL